MKETDEFMNLYSKNAQKNFLTIIQAPITVSSNGWVNVNQSIVIPEGKKRKQLEDLLRQYKDVKETKGGSRRKDQKSPQKIFYNPTINLTKNSITNLSNLKSSQKRSKIRIKNSRKTSISYKK